MLASKLRPLRALCLIHCNHVAGGARGETEESFVEIRLGLFQLVDILLSQATDISKVE